MSLSLQAKISAYMSDQKDELAENHCDELVENDNYGASTQSNLHPAPSLDKGIHRRRFLKGSITGVGLSLMAGCTGSSPETDDEEEPAIDENESYGFDREGTTYEFEAGYQNQLAFGDAIRLGNIVIHVEGIEWNVPNVGSNQARVFVRWINLSSSTVISYPDQRFSLYDKETNDEMDRRSRTEDGYSGQNEVQPESEDTGYIAFDIPDEYETLQAFKFTLFAPSNTTTGDRDIDVAWINEN